MEFSNEYEIDDNNNNQVNSCTMNRTNKKVFNNTGKDIFNKTQINLNDQIKGISNKNLKNSPNDKINKDNKNNFKKNYNNNKDKSNKERENNINPNQGDKFKIENNKQSENYSNNKNPKKEDLFSNNKNLGYGINNHLNQNLSGNIDYNKFNSILIKDNDEIDKNYEFSEKINEETNQQLDNYQDMKQRKISDLELKKSTKMETFLDYGNQIIDYNNNNKKNKIIKGSNHYKKSQTLDNKLISENKKNYLDENISDIMQDIEKSEK